MTAILHESGPVRYWDHDLGPDSLRLQAAEIAGVGAPADAARAAGGADAVTTDEPVPETRDLTPDPGRALDEQTFEVAPGGSLVVTGWSVWDDTGSMTDEVHVIDVATGKRSALLAAPGFDFTGPRISPDGRLVACRRAGHDTYDALGDVTLVIAPLDGEMDPDGTGSDMPDARAGLPARADGRGAPGGRPEAVTAARAGPPARADGTGGPADTASRSGGPGVTPRANTGTDLLSGMDRRPLEAAWAPDSRSVYFTADDEGRRPVFRADLATGEITRLTTDNGAYDNLCPAPDGRFLYALRSAVDGPPTPPRC